MRRRQLFRTALAAGGVAVGSAISPWTLRPALATQSTGPYGPVGEPDENGIRLPQGFTSRVIARAGQPVTGTAYTWHVFPDGGAAFATEDGGWIYASNSEVPGVNAGGVGAVRFTAAGEVADAYRILSGTQMNCAGGPTPWGTWLSCEEYEWGLVWECDPYVPASQGTQREAMGTFTHEAAAVDPSGKRVYLTEDQPDGGFYRFTPAAYPDLSAGLLEIAVVEGHEGKQAAGSGAVRWVEVPHPNAAQPTPTRRQIPASTAFDGGEGIWYGDGVVFFTTKGDHRVWSYRPRSGRLDVIYDAGARTDPPIYGVDNLTVAEGGDIYVAEDPASRDTPALQLMLITPEHTVSTFAAVVDQAGSELTGPAFSPAGDRLYLSSQRGGPVDVSSDQPGSGFGITYEIRGPFRGRPSSHGVRASADAARPVT